MRRTCIAALVAALALLIPSAMALTCAQAKQQVRCTGQPLDAPSNGMH